MMSLYQEHQHRYKITRGNRDRIKRGSEDSDWKTIPIYGSFMDLILSRLFCNYIARRISLSNSTITNDLRDGNENIELNGKKWI